MRPESTKEAYNLGERMFRTDAWLTNALRGAREAAQNGGKEGLLLVVRDLAKDDHFHMNWWPLVKRIAGNEKEATVLLHNVWQGFADAFMDDHFGEIHAATPALENFDTQTKKRR